MAKISMADIAKVLGVSKTLVSMVLNGKGDAHGISRETQKKVLDKVKELNYRPNQVARGLRTGKSNVIGLIVPDISNYFFARMAKRIEELTEKEGYTLMIASSDEKEEKENKLIDLFQNKLVDGLIIASTQEKSETFKHLKKSDYPFVLVDRKMAKLETNFVGIDNQDGAYQATNHLIKQGYKKVGLLSISPSHLSNIKDRVSGYKSAMTDANLRVERSFIREIPFDGIKDAVLEVLKELMSKENGLRALVVLNNNIATAVVEAANELDIRIPIDLALVSFDEIELFKFSSPPITCVAQPIEAIGEEAVRLLMNKVKEGKIDSEEVVLKTKLVVRKSCGEYLN